MMGRRGEGAGRSLPGHPTSTEGRTTCRTNEMMVRGSALQPTMTGVSRNIFSNVFHTIITTIYTGRVFVLTGDAGFLIPHDWNQNCIGSGEYWSATISHFCPSRTRKNMSLPSMVCFCPPITNVMEKRYVTTALFPPA